jgi:hypothetical protein
MPNFKTELDNKFKELIPKIENDNFKINDLLKLKSFIYQNYRNNYGDERENIKKAYNKIDYKI